MFAINLLLRAIKAGSGGGVDPLPLPNRIMTWYSKGNGTGGFKKPAAIIDTISGAISNDSTVSLIGSGFGVRNFSATRLIDYTDRSTADGVDSANYSDVPADTTLPDGRIYPTSSAVKVEIQRSNFRHPFSTGHYIAPEDVDQTFLGKPYATGGPDGYDSYDAGFGAAALPFRASFYQKFKYYPENCHCSTFSALVGTFEVGEPVIITGYVGSATYTFATIAENVNDLPNPFMCFISDTPDESIGNFVGGGNTTTVTGANSGATATWGASYALELSNNRLSKWGRWWTSYSTVGLDTTLVKTSSPTPSSGEWSIDGETLRVSKTDSLAADISGIISQFRFGAGFQFEDSGNAANFVEYKISSLPIDGGSYFEYQVILMSSGGIIGDVLCAATGLVAQYHPRMSTRVSSLSEGGVNGTGGYAVPQGVFPDMLDWVHNEILYHPGNQKVYWYLDGVKVDEIDTSSSGSDYELVGYSHTMAVLGQDTQRAWCQEQYWGDINFDHDIGHVFVSTSSDVNSLTAKVESQEITSWTPENIGVRLFQGALPSLTGAFLHVVTDIKPDGQKVGGFIEL